MLPKVKHLKNLYALDLGTTKFCLATLLRRDEDSVEQSADRTIRPDPARFQLAHQRLLRSRDPRAMIGQSRSRSILARRGFKLRHRRIGQNQRIAG